MSPTHSTLTQETYDQEVLRYGKELYLLTLRQVNLVVNYGGVSPKKNSFDFFQQIFPLFEKEAQKFYSIQDPHLELLELFFQSLTEAADFKSLKNLMNDTDLHHLEHNLLGFFTQLIEQSSSLVLSYAKTPLYEKIMLQKLLPATPQGPESTVFQHKI